MPGKPTCSTKKSFSSRARCHRFALVTLRLSVLLLQVLELETKLSYERARSESLSHSAPATVDRFHAKELAAQAAERTSAEAEMTRLRQEAQ